MKKKIRIRFIGFWEHFDQENNFLTDILRKKYEVEICDDADYAFISVFDLNFSECTFPGIRIFYSGENMPPDFSIHDYGISFDWIEYKDRYLRYPFGLTVIDEQRNQYKPEKYSGRPEDKQFFAVFMHSHPGSEYRTELFNKLSEYKHVVSPGKYLHNADIVVPDVPSRIPQIDFESKAKFVIACENTSFPGYVTEKLDLALQAKSIPIYYGDPTVCEDYNPKSFINCMDYPSLDAVLERVKEIDQNDELYASIINEQPYRDKDYVKKSHDRLESFLFNIFDQDYEKAFRRPSHEEQNFCMIKEVRLRKFSRFLNWRLYRNLSWTKNRITGIIHRRYQKH